MKIKMGNIRILVHILSCFIEEFRISNFQIWNRELLNTYLN
jgi:hypothetical protein